VVHRLSDRAELPPCARSYPAPSHIRRAHAAAVEQRAVAFPILEIYTAEAADIASDEAKRTQGPP
jgi:hypothetical protein